MIGKPPQKQETNTRTYEFRVAPGIIKPDGIPKKALLVNGQFPGPLITANYGETIEVIVSNRLHNDGTSLHYHGLIQNGTPWYDGTPGSQTCPIAPGDSFRQKFTADQHGVSWWHSHYSAQHVDGLKGPIIIHGPISAPYDVDLGAVFLSDWYHRDHKYYIRLENSESGPIPFLPDSNLINGKGQYNCTLGYDCPRDTPYSVFHFQHGKKHLLRVISTTSDFYQCFSIDGHQLQVVSVDFVPVQPYFVDCLSLHNGQRAEVVVRGHMPTHSSWLMRARLQPGVPDAPISTDHLTSVAVVYYERANMGAVPSTSPSPNIASQCAHEVEASNHPILPQPVVSPTIVEDLRLTLEKNATGHTLFYFNNRTFHGDYNHPLLTHVRAGNTAYETDWNVYDFASNATVRLIFTSTSNMPHALHFHGHNVQIIAQGSGIWDGRIINLNNPSRRDTMVIPPGTQADPSHLIVQWEANNPGVWPFHCHTAWHSSLGMLFNIVEQPRQLMKMKLDPTTAEALKKQCRNWQNFTNHHGVDQMDSGL